ncbi:MAG: FtsX-like permease family protein [Vicinamibacteria bacterium]|nr:FtsX-like permease family protein [Vicinamibacteria bacterium]
MTWWMRVALGLYPAREIAVRMALGARGREVQAMFLRRGLAIVSAGLAIGAAAAAYLTRGLGELLFGVALLDPLTYAASAALLVVAGAMAVWVPSRGASALAPAAVLRS